MEVIYFQVTYRTWVSLNPASWNRLLGDPQTCQQSRDSLARNILSWHSPTIVKQVIALQAVQKEIVKSGMGVSGIFVGGHGKVGSMWGGDFTCKNEVSESCVKKQIWSYLCACLFYFTLSLSLSAASADFPYNPGQGQAIRNGVNRNSAIIGGMWYIQQTFSQLLTWEKQWFF